jgi:hypothetical protein
MGGSVAIPSKDASFAPMTPINAIDFEGETSREVPAYLSILPRTNSVDVVNDPRVFQDSVIGKRFAAFQTVAVGATLMATLSLTTAVGIMPEPNTWVVCGALSFMLIVFVLNIFCVMVITQQYYQIHRLITCGAHGFDIAKSYYLNENITRLRHAATQSFFYALPMYVLSVAFMAHAKMAKNNPYHPMAITALAVLSFCGLMMLLVINKQRQVFCDHHASSKKYLEPLVSHMNTVHMRTMDNDQLLG